MRFGSSRFHIRIGLHWWGLNFSWPPVRGVRVGALFIWAAEKAGAGGHDLAAQPRMHGAQGQESFPLFFLGSV